METEEPIGRHATRKVSVWLGLIVVVALAGVFVTASLKGSGDESPTGAAVSPEPSPPTDEPAPEPSPTPSPKYPRARPINTGIEGLTTFRGNATRTYYGRGPVPKAPEVLWRYPASGGLCSTSSDPDGEREWCGTGWTGQPNVAEVDGRHEVRFGALDGAVHVLDGATGAALKTPFRTGDLIKGTVSTDPDGYPLLYTGSRDGYFRILAMDRGSEMIELWALPASSAPNPVWNNDWDGSALVVDDYLIVGGENSWFYVVKLNRGYDGDGLVTVEPEIRMLVPGFDDQLFSDLGDSNVSIESSVALHDDVAYFANSGGLVQGWDIGRVLNGGRKHKQVFRFWTGDDTDATVVVGEKGELYVASQQERFNARSAEVGQLMRLDPTRPFDPIVWSLPVPGVAGEDGGLWATPAIHKRALFVTTNSGRLLAVDRVTGQIAWELPLARPAWSSPVVVGRKLIVGDCGGVLRAYDVKRPLSGPPEELWQVSLGGCIESTPAVWKGMIYVGTKAGAVYGIGDR